MKKLLLFLFIIVVIVGAASAKSPTFKKWSPEYKKFITVHTIGSGSGTFGVTSMTGYAVGDEIAVVDGTYTSGNFSNLNGIKIHPVSNRVYVTGTISFQSNKYLEVYGFDHNNSSVPLFDAQTSNNNNIYFHNIAGKNNTAELFSSGQNNPHRTYVVGDTTSFEWYKCRVDSITTDNSVRFWFAGNGTLVYHNDQSDSVYFSRIKITNAAITGAARGAQIQFSGCFRLHVADMTILYNGIQTPDGDVGAVYNKGGNGTIERVYINGGGSGYIARFYTNQETAHPSPLIVKNCAKFNSSEYGGVSVQNEPGTNETGVTDCDVYIEGITLGNAADQITYWCSVFVTGAKTDGKIQSVTNCLGFNNTVNGKPFIVENQGNAACDTSGNKYYTSSTAAGLDGGTTVINGGGLSFPAYRPLAGSSTLAQGGSNNWATTDFFNVPLPTHRDVGYAQKTPTGANQPPQAVISGSNPTSITLPTNSVTLVGTGSSDPDGTIAAYSWQWISGPSNITPATPVASSTAINGLIQGTYVYQLKVTDNGGLTNTTQRTIVVNPASTGGGGTTITVGNGSGALTINGSTNPSYNGAQLKVASGTYTNFNISNLNSTTETHIEFGPDVVITGGSTAGNLHNVNLSDVNVLHSNATVVTWNGSNDHVREHNWYVSGTSGAVNDISYNQTYTGNASSMVMQFFRMDSSYIWHSGQIIIGNFGAGANNAGFMDSIQIDHTTIYNTTSNGTQLRGIMWRVGYQFIHNTYDSLGGVNPVLGDVGELYIYGSITGCHHNVTNGGRGYLIRLWGSKLQGRLDVSQVFECVRMNTHTYGMINPTSANGDGQIDGTYTSLGGRFIIHHLTEANVTDNINYWPPVMLGGELGPMTVYGHNSLGCAILEGSGISADRQNKNKIYVDQSAQTAHPDTANNRYYVSCTNVVDLTTGKKLLVVNDATGNAIGATVSGPTVTVSPTGTTTIHSPTNSIVFTATGSSPTGNISSYFWSLVSGPGTVSYSAQNSNVSTITFNTASNTVPYVIRQTVTDNSGNQASSDQTVFYISNIPPTAHIVPTPSNATIKLPTNTLSLSGATSADGDGTISAYLWTQISGPNTATIQTPTANASNFNNLIAGNYVFQLKVTDNGGATGTATQSVTVQPANISPVSVISGTQLITYPASLVNWSGTGSSDADGTIARYIWTQTSGPTSTIATPFSSTTNITAPTAGTYVYQLLVKDNDSLTGTSQRTLIVNNPPTAKIYGPAAISQPGTSVVLKGDSSTDTDGTIVSYAWTRSSGPTSVTITNATSANATMSGLTSLGTYVFQLVVTDDKGSSSVVTKSVTVNSNPNQPPHAVITGQTAANQPITSVGYSGTGSSDPDGVISSNLWTLVSGPSGASLSSTTASTTTITKSGGLAVGSYVLKLRVTDNGGLSDSTTLTLVVSPPVNNPPVAIIQNVAPVVLPNYATLDGTHSTDDNGIISYAWAKVSGSGNVTFGTNNQPTTTVILGSADTYRISLTVTDSGGLNNTSFVDIVVNPIPPVPTVGGAIIWKGKHKKYYRR